VAVLVELLIIAFAVLLLYGSVRMALSTFHDTIPTLGISEAWRYAPPMLASLLIGFFSIVHLIAPSDTEQGP
jgi:TRAP-type C4-dicarboxylate transport system permease small subunit